MKTWDYMGFYGALFISMAAVGAFIKIRFPDAVEDSFITGHITVGVALLLCVVMITLCNFGEWVMHFFK